jgi:hypothetical protein
VTATAAGTMTVTVTVTVIVIVTPKGTVRLTTTSVENTYLM